MRFGKSMNTIMIDLDARSYRVAAWGGAALLVAAMVYIASRGQWVGVGVLAAFLIAAIVFIVYEDDLPALFDVLFVIAALLNAVGWAWDAFHWPGPYDEITHAFTTFAVTLSLGFLTFYSVRAHFEPHGILFILTIASFGIAIGGVWEIVEWAAGVIGTLGDTVVDLIMDTIGALAAGAVNLWALRKVPHEKLKQQRKTGLL